MNLIYLSLFSLSVIGGVLPGPIWANKKPKTAEVACANLLGMVNRNYLAHTVAGSDYPSGFKYTGPVEAPDQIAIFFGSLRTDTEEDQVTEAFEAASVQTRIHYLHQLSLAFAFTALNLTDLMSSTEVHFEGQEDGHPLFLLLHRQQFIRDKILPLVLENLPEIIPRYFDELLAIAANFSNVPTAYGIAIKIIDAIEPTLWVYQVSGGTRNASDLAKIKSHATANEYLEDHVPTDEARVFRAVYETSGSLRAVHPGAHLAWLVPQLAYWFQVGFTTKGTPAFDRASRIVNLLAEVLPADLSFVTDSHPEIAREIQLLIDASPWVPGLMTNGNVRRLQSLIVKH